MEQNHSTSKESFDGLALALSHPRAIPQVFGRYKTPGSASARAYEVARHPNNTPGINFVVRTFSDGAYIMAYLTEKQRAMLETTIMSLALWQDYHSGELYG